MLSKIVLPNEVNYIAAFLTLRCNLNCYYCINRQGDFVVSEEMSARDWIKGLSHIETREDLPITLCGGEPTIHPGFYEIVKGLEGKHLDLLTNGTFDLEEFCKQIPPSAFKREAKYASIRFSYHEKMEPVNLVLKVWELQNRGYSVGIWGLDCNEELNRYMKNMCDSLKLDFRIKEYLDKTHGTYKYPEAINGKKNKVYCKTSELLFSPSGHIFKCHADLYANRLPLGHILDKIIPDFSYRECNSFGFCSPCDIKLKFNRFQESGHCSVTIKGGNDVV
jgi:hypothetical protein